jgi:hypothetical protein
LTGRSYKPGKRFCGSFNENQATLFQDTRDRSYRCQPCVPYRKALHRNFACADMRMLTIKPKPPIQYYAYIFPFTYKTSFSTTSPSITPSSSCL